MEYGCDTYRELLSALPTREPQLLPRLLSFRDFCRASPYPECTPRAAQYLLSLWYFQAWDLLRARSHCLLALDFPGDVPSDPQLHSHLLRIYTQMNEPTRIREEILLLSGYLSDTSHEETSLSLQLSLLAAARKLDVPMTEVTEAFRQWLCADGSEEDTAHCVSRACLVMEAMLAVLDSTEISPEERARYDAILRHYLSSGQYSFTRRQKAGIYHLLMKLHRSAHPQACMRALRQAISFCHSLPPAHEARISTLRLGALIAMEQHRSQDALGFLDAMHEGITAAWQQTLSQMEDHRIPRLLFAAQTHVQTGFGILRQTASAEVHYESVLRFKSLSSLVIRERNRILRHYPGCAALKEKIHTLQEADGSSPALWELETALADSLPKSHRFTEISFQRFSREIPENTALLEYCFAPAPASLEGNAHRPTSWQLDLFVTVKQGGICRLSRFSLENGDEIKGLSARLMDILHSPKRELLSREKLRICRSLFRSLLAPALPLLEGVTQLYIAPDEALCNLPFEILCADAHPPLEQRFRVCRMVCGRDFLFRDDTPAGEGAFVLGNPDFGACPEGDSRSSRPAPLPHSAAEARRVARRLGTEPCLGSDATVRSLRAALPCRFLHFATHGIFDTASGAHPLQAAMLLLSGKDGAEPLTAEDISRMQLGETELVVLSACDSGVTDHFWGCSQGLVSAFSAAGVRWVVTHLWKASDFATAILMDAFYRELSHTTEVPDALRRAREYLRTVTAFALRQEGWHLPESLSDTARPFSDDYYWGGFVCHQCK